MLIGSAALIVFYTTGARGAYNHNAFGHCVRCIKDAISNVEKKLETELTIYPNPFNDIISMRLKKGEIIKKVTIYDAIGVLIKEIEISSNFINLSNLNMGVYLIVVKTNKGINIKKLIKK